MIMIVCGWWRDNFYFSILKISTLQANSYGELFTKTVVESRPCTLFISRVLIKDILIAIFRMAFTGKQIIVRPLNKDHRATYHQGQVSIP